MTRSLNQRRLIQVLLIHAVDINDFFQPLKRAITAGKEQRKVWDLAAALSKPENQQACRFATCRTTKPLRPIVRCLHIY